MSEHEHDHIIKNIPDAHAAMTHKLGFLPTEALAVIVTDDNEQPVWTANHNLKDGMDFDAVAGQLATALSHTPYAMNVILCVYTSGEDATTRAMTWLMVMAKRVREAGANVVNLAHIDVPNGVYETFVGDESTHGSLDEPRVGYPHEPLTITEQDLLVRVELDDPITVNPEVEVTKGAVVPVVQTNWGLWSDEDVNLLTVAINTRVAARRFYLKETLERPEELVDGWAYLVRRVDDADTRAHFGALCSVAELLRDDTSACHRILKATCQGTNNQLGSMVMHLLLHAHELPNMAGATRSFFEHQLAQTQEWDDLWDRRD